MHAWCGGYAYMCTYIVEWDSAFVWGAMGMGIGVVSVGVCSPEVNGSAPWLFTNVI